MRLTPWPRAASPRPHRKIDRTKKLRRLKVHGVALGGADQRTYARHGYFGAMKTQLDHGIFDDCDAKVMTSEFLLPSEVNFPDAHCNIAKLMGQNMVA